MPSARTGARKNRSIGQVPLSYAATEDAAAEAAHHQWAQAYFASSVLADLRSPAQFDALSAAISTDEIDRRLRISADPGGGISPGWPRMRRMGFSQINLHNVCREEQERFIDLFAERVLPELRLRTEDETETMRPNRALGQRLRTEVARPVGESRSRFVPMAGRQTAGCRAARPVLTSRSASLRSKSPSP